MSARNFSSPPPPSSTSLIAEAPQSCPQIPDPQQRYPQRESLGEIRAVRPVKLSFDGRGHAGEDGKHGNMERAGKYKECTNFIMERKRYIIIPNN